MRRVIAVVTLSVCAVAARAATGPVFSVGAHWRDGLPPEGGSGTVQVTVTVQPGWHVNSNTPLEDYLIPTSVRIDAPAGWSAGPAAFPPHKLVKLAFSETRLAVYEGSFTVDVPVRRAHGAPVPSSIRGTVEAQACNDSVCMAPAEVGFVLAAAGNAHAPQSAPSTTAGLAASPIPEAQGALPPLTEFSGAAPTPAGLSSQFVHGGLLLQLAIVFLAGLALNLTPCVYPLIPITVGFFAAQRATSRSTTWSLAILYIVGMSVTYSALGVVAALTGKLFGSALQSPWVVGGVVIVLLALATSMFGLWEIRVPAWATRASGGRTGLGGALVMGLAVGLVAAPCIGPFVLGLLTYVGQRQDVILGFTLFFTLSLGLGIPYLVLAISTRALEKLPNSGAWMLGVRQVFGVLLVALAGYFVRPFLPAPRGDWLFAGLLVAGGAYLLLVARPGHEQPAVDRVMRAASAAILLAGALLLPRQVRPSSGLPWRPYDRAEVETALAAGKPVIMDFYATWCAPCKELDEKTFSDAEVARQLAGFTRFKVDLTRNEPVTDALRARYGVLGVPTVAFFQHGREVPNARLTGFEPPSDFLLRLDRVLGP